MSDQQGLGDLARRLAPYLAPWFLRADFTGITAQVYNSANISIANNTVTALTFDSERANTNGMHSVSVNTGRLTVVTAGNYTITGNVSFAANATGIRVVTIRANGTTDLAKIVAQAVTTGDVTVLPVSKTVSLGVGEYVELTVFQTSGGNLNVLASANYSPEFTAVRVP